MEIKMENINLTGEELRKLLKIFGYTQPEFAEYCNKSTATIKRQLCERQVSRRFSEKFIELVGEKSFDYELRVIRSRNRLRVNNPRYLFNELCDKKNDHLTLQEFRDKVFK